MNENAALTEQAGDAASKLQGLVEVYGPKVLGALAILVVGWIVAKIITGILRKVMGRSKVEPMLVGFIGNLTYMGLMALVVITALGALGVQTGSFAAVIAAAGLAIGFALQGSLGNFAAGVMIMLFKPFKVGDYIEGGGTAGVVEDVQVFCTMLKTPDNKKVIVPNSGMTGGNIVNYSAKDTRRVDLVFGIGYGDDIKKAKDILEDIMTKDERVLKDPALTIAVSELGDSSVNLVCRPWVNSADYWGVLFDTTEAVKLAFDAQGISIPFPQQDVHMHQVGAVA